MAKYTIPEYLGKVYGNWNENDKLYIIFSGKKLTSLGSYIRAENSIKTGTNIGTWKFLAPNEIMESVSHEWEEFEGYGQRVAQKFISIKHFQEETTGVSKAAESLANNNRDINNVLGKADIPEHKVDSTIVYKTSQRRQYNLDFEINFWYEDDPKEKIFKPIRELEKWSCANTDGNNFTKIEFPAVFHIKTSTPLINIKYAAITAVQPTWMAPYIKGYPSRARLTISFIDIEPLYRKSWGEI